MDTSDRLELHKELYFRELDRRSQIDSSVAVPATIVVAIFGAISFLIRFAPYKTPNIAEWYFYIPVALSLIAALRSAVYLLKTYNRAVYTELSFPDRLEKYFQELKSGGIKYLAEKAEYDNQIRLYLDDNPGEKESGLQEVEPFSAEESFQQFLIEEFAKLSTENKTVNSERGLHLHFSMTSLYVSLAFLLMAWVIVGVLTTQS